MTQQGKYKIGKEKYYHEYKKAHAREFVLYKVAHRCRENGMEFDKEHLLSLKCPKLCPILGTSISFKRGEGTRRWEETASFDRIDNRRGYIKGNVKIISRKANFMKSDMSLKQAKALVRYMKG